MSRGPGRIERAIHDLIEEHPDGAWTTEDLCHLIYPAASRAEKKHRVAMLRAMKTIRDKSGDRHRDWRLLLAGSTGRTLVLHNFANVMSYGLARLKSDHGWFHRNEEELLERLQPGGRNYNLVVSGGAWDRHVRKYIAERDGDQETVERLAAEQKRSLAAIFSKKRGNR